MKTKCSIAILALAITLSFAACENDWLSEKMSDSGDLARVIILDNVKLVPSSSAFSSPDVYAHYDEMACTVWVDTVLTAGTLCFESVGNSCKRPHSCEPISGAASSGKYTKEELDRKIQLVEESFGIKYIY